VSGFVGGGTTVKTSAPVIGSLQLQTSAYGRAVTVVYGRNRITPNIIDIRDFKAIKHTESQSSGKGGGGVTTESTTYTYTTAILLALCEGPIEGVARIWRDKAWNYADKWGLDIFNGSYSQTPYGYWLTNHPGSALAYRGVAYAASGAYDLGDSAQIPNHSFEVQGFLRYSVPIIDADPSAVVSDILTNPNYGAGFTSGAWFVRPSIGGLAEYSKYCVANGLFISPAYTSQAPAKDAIDSILQLTNAAAFFSENTLKIVPYASETAVGNGVTFTPITTPVYDLTNDDFLIESSDDMPVTIDHNNVVDRFNEVRLRFKDRGKDYNENVATASDQAAIDEHGLRAEDAVDAFEVVDANVAAAMAQMRLQRNLYFTNTYNFRLGWKYVDLEPMDIVTLTDTVTGLDQQPVRIISVEEDEYGTLTMIAEDYLGTVGPALYDAQSAGGYAPNWNESPGDANVPIIFEAPENLTIGPLEVWVLASGGTAWGGAQVWLSSDGTSYSYHDTIKLPARQGVLAGTLSGSAPDPDPTATIAIDMSLSRSAVLSGSQSDVDAFNTLCYADGELIAYRDSTLTGANAYTLGYLRRGVFGSAIAAHSSGAQFCRLDADSVVRVPFDSSRIGQTIYVKLLSFNVWGGGLQGLADVTAYTHTITGTAMNSPPKNIANIHTNHVSNLTKIYWDIVQDFRTVEYEVRMGSTWANGTVQGRVSAAEYTVPGNGTYWVAARVLGANGIGIYSVTPQQAIISGATLVQNVIATFDEPATGWTGALSGGASITGGTTLQLEFTGDISLVPDFGALTDVGAYGDVSPTGAYTADPSHRIVLAAVASTTVQISYDVTAYVVGLGTVLDPGPDVSVTPQIRLSQDGGSTWGAWQDYKPGVYVFSALDWRVNLESRNVNVTPQVTNLEIMADVPDLFDAGHVTTSAAGVVSYTYAQPFNGGNDPTGGGAGLPVVQITIGNASAGDLARITNKTLTGFDIDVVNGGSRVVRSVDIAVQGY